MIKDPTGHATRFNKKKKKLKTDKNGLIARINKHIEAIAKERDELRYDANAVDSILESCDEAIEQLESAVDTLSQYL